MFQDVLGPSNHIPKIISLKPELFDPPHFSLRKFRIQKNNCCLVAHPNICRCHSFYIKKKKKKNQTTDPKPFDFCRVTIYLLFYSKFSRFDRDPNRKNL